MQKPGHRLALAAASLCGAAAQPRTTPAAGHHRHMFSEEISALPGPGSGR